LTIPSNTEQVSQDTEIQNTEVSVLT